MKKPTIYIVIITILIVIIGYLYIDCGKKTKLRVSEIDSLKTKIAALQAAAPAAPAACSFGGVIPCPIGTPAAPVDIDLHNRHFDFSQLDAAGGYKLYIRDNTDTAGCACWSYVDSSTATTTPFLYMKVKLPGGGVKKVNFFTTAPDAGMTSSFQLKYAELTVHPPDPTSGLDKQNQDVVNNTYTSLTLGTNEEKFIGTDDWRNGFTGPTTWHLFYVERGAIGLMRNYLTGKLEVKYKPNGGGTIYKDAKSVINATIIVNTNSN